jgi:DNA repair exonuclease SbcCD ATPase subunit
MDAADLQALVNERTQLQEADAAGRWAALQVAQSGHAHLRQQLQELAKQLDAFPESDRRDPEEVSQELADARKAQLAAAGALGALEQDLKSLEEQRERRTFLAGEQRICDRRRQLAEKLHELLGPKRLQRYLLCDAERGIVDNANRLLGRLCNGLNLRLLPEEENEKQSALQLECEAAHGQIRNLSFLSGSEKFRVAVSLALGIGQYASRRPIESVIMDEGFGCLDRNNRSLMIEEIKALRNDLKSILLVSHQEEFATEFREGYSFRLEDGTTRVTPMSG